MGSEDDEEQEEVATAGYADVELDDERREDDEEDGPATVLDSFGKAVFLDPVKLPGRLLAD